MRKFFTILVLVAFSLPLWAQDSVAVPGTYELPEIEYGMSRKTYEIASIEVEGADSYDDFVLIGFSGLAVGDKIEVPGDQVTKAIKRFWKQGLFSNVKIKAKKIEGNKIWLVIELEQRPRVSEVRYEGLKKSEKEDVEVKAGIRQGSQMTPNVEDHCKTVIKKYLAEKGFHNAEIHVIQRPDPDHPGYVKVLVGVDKKAKTKVGKIYITGNEALTDLDINKAMKKTNDDNIINLFRTKKFVREEYEKDKIAVIEKYNECGYRDAYIVADSVVPNPEDPTRVDVYMTISEGDKYYIRSVKWVGNTVYPYELLDMTLGVKPGDVYNLKTLNNRLTGDDDAVAKLYTDRGYLFFNVEPVEVNVENDSIDFEMRMYEGKPATINEVKIVGNTRVYEHVVRRELYTKPGQLYSQSDIIDLRIEAQTIGNLDEKAWTDIVPSPPTRSSSRSVGVLRVLSARSVSSSPTSLSRTSSTRSRTALCRKVRDRPSLSTRVRTVSIIRLFRSLSWSLGSAVSARTASAQVSISRTRRAIQAVTRRRTKTSITPIRTIITIPATITTTSS